jgi:hypothetical protein
VSARRLTGWHGALTRPIHAGVYQVAVFGGEQQPWYAYFDGFKWSYGGATPEQAAANRDRFTQYQNREWRGLCA